MATSNISLGTIISTISEISTKLNKELKGSPTKTLFYISVDYPNKTLALQLSSSPQTAAKLLSSLNKEIPVEIFIKYILQQKTNSHVTVIKGYPISYEKIATPRQKTTIFYIDNEKDAQHFFVREISNTKTLIERIIADMIKND